MSSKSKALENAKHEGKEHQKFDVSKLSPGFSGMHKMSIQHIKQQRMNKKVAKMHKPTSHDVKNWHEYNNSN